MNNAKELEQFNEWAAKQTVTSPKTGWLACAEQKEMDVREMWTAANDAITAHDDIPDVITPNTSVQRLEYKMEKQRIAVLYLREVLAKHGRKP